MLIAMLVGQVMSKRIFTTEQAHKKRKGQWFWWWARKTLPLHPMATGFVIGIFWQDPEGVDWPWVASPMYFAAFGGGSIWAYEVIKGLLKKKGVNVGELPGGSVPPPKGDK
jgi:hypothetical protein